MLTCRTTGATGTVVSGGNVNYTIAAGARAADDLNNGGATATIDTTGTLALDVTVTWDSATTTRSITTNIVEVQIDG